MWELWANWLSPKVLKSCPKCKKKSPNLVTLMLTFLFSRPSTTTVKLLVVTNDSKLKQKKCTYYWAIFLTHLINWKTQPNLSNTNLTWTLHLNIDIGNGEVCKLLQIYNSYTTLGIQLGQWLCLSWQSGRFWHQRFAVRILPLAKFYWYCLLSTRYIEKTKIKKKRPGMAHLKKHMAEMCLLVLTYRGLDH